MASAPKSRDRADSLRISAVVPVYRNDDAVHRLMGLLHDDTAPAETRVDECIVVAAESDIAALTTALPGTTTRIIESEPGRGQQLNTGAHAATGDILWFLHADATPPAGAASAIRGHVASGGDGGWFRFRFEGVDGRGAARLAALINWRARRGIAYGDQGLFFSAEAFDRWGGFEDVPLFEEVRLVRAAKAGGAFAELPLDIGVDPRRWQQSGWIRRTLANRALALGHAAGISPERLARWYRRW